MARKKNVSGCGCFAYLIVAGLVLSIIAAIFGGIFILFSDIMIFIVKLIETVIIGVRMCFPFLGVLVVAAVLYKLVFFYQHRSPLSYDQIKALAGKYAEDYIDEAYTFTKEKQEIDMDLKTNLNPNGEWYNVNIPVKNFPKYVAELLNKKHHEWVILGIEQDSMIRAIWANKGEDSKSVSINCEIGAIIQKCKELNGCSVFRLHNHPNPDPKRYMTLVASDLDKESAKSCSEIVCKEGIHWFDFVCAQGDFVMFYRKVANSFEVPGKTTSDIIDKIGITQGLDYDLQCVYRKEVLGKSILDRKAAGAVLVLFLISAFFVGASNSDVWDKMENDSRTQQDKEQQTLSWYSPMLEEFEYEYEDDGITLLEFKGDEKAIIVPEKYTVEDTELPVLKLDGTFDNNRNVVGVVLSEGIREVSSNTFYNCDQLKRLYIPSTVEESIYFVEYLTNGEILYFGGNEEQWEKLKNAKTAKIIRSDIPFEKVEIDSPIGTCIKDINNEFKSEYTSSENNTPLKAFNYDVENDEIELDDYIGESDIVKISSEYEVDGIRCHVRKLENTFASRSVRLVIIPEGVEKVGETIFVGSGLQYLYLPKSLKNVSDYFWQSLQDIDTLYYGGSKEDFEKICKIDRWDLDVKHVEYDIDPDTITYEAD